VIDATLLHPLAVSTPCRAGRAFVDDLPGVGAQGVGISVPEWRGTFESSGIFQSASITGTGEKKRETFTGSAQPLRLSFKPSYAELLYFAVLGVDAPVGAVPSMRMMQLPATNLEGRDQRRALAEGIRSRPPHNSRQKRCRPGPTTSITSWA